MAAPDSIEPALKHIEMNASEGYPRKSCFSLDWMLLESKKHSERLKFSPEGLEQLETQYKKMAELEIERRAAAKSKGKVAEEVLFDGKSIRFFELQCAKCRNYCYLSAIGCKNCEKMACLSCGSVCSCEIENKTMFIRHTDSELINY